jgi:hypothetical protein
MNRFFVENEVYEDRIEICKGCAYYYKPTGSCKICMCFMKIKARIANQHCPQKYWHKTSEVMKAPDDLPQEIIDAILNMTNTNCGSCISTCFDGIKKLYKKYSQ